MGQGPGLVLSTALAKWGLTWFLQSSAVLAVGLIAGRLSRGAGPAIQSGVYRTTLAAALGCSLASIAFTAAGIDGIDVLPDEAAVATSRTVTDVAQPALRWTGPAATEPPVESLTTTTRPMPGTPAPRDGAAAAALEACSPLPLPLAAPAGLAVWAFGAMALALRLGVGHWRMARIRAAAVAAGPDATALCRDLAARLGVRPPTVWRSPFLFSPCLDGLLRPAILLPDDVEGDLGDTFVHELAHLARRDGHWNVLRRWATAVFWLQPLLWILSRRIEATAEEVCDDIVVHHGGDRVRYARHLVDLAGRALPPVASAGVGMVSLRSLLARRIVRILDSSRSLSTRAGRRAVLVMLAAGLAGTAFVGLLGAGKAARPAQARASEPNAESEDRTVRGQVLGPDGRPVPDATVIASQSRLLPAGASVGIGDDRGRLSEQIVGKVRGDAEGRFAFSFDSSAMRPAVAIIATAPGFGMGYALKDRPIRLRAGDLPIRGRLVDPEGRPVAGVKVELGQVYVPAPEVTGKLPDPADPASVTDKLGLDGWPLLPGGTSTDADGRFRIEGLGRDTLANLTLSGPAVALRRVRVLTRAMGRFDGRPLDPTFLGFDDPAIHGADCTIVVEPSRPIEGVVKDVQTGAPIAAAVVTASQLSGSDLTVDGLISATTDDRGRYRLNGLPKEGAKGHRLAVYPPLDQPYFVTRRLEAPARPGYGPVLFNLALRRGVWIAGRVTDLAAGRPVQAALAYFPFLSNSHAKDYPNFDPNIASSIRLATRHRTDADGRFRIPALPGGGVVAAHTDDRSFRAGAGAESIAGRTGRNQLLTYDRIFMELYQGLKEVRIDVGTPETVCDIRLDRGGTARVRLVVARANFAAALAAGGLNTDATPPDLAPLAARHGRAGGREATLSFFGELLNGRRPDPAIVRRLAAAAKGKGANLDPLNLGVAQLLARPESQLT